MLSATKRPAVSVRPSKVWVAMQVAGSSRNGDLASSALAAACGPAVLESTASSGQFWKSFSAILNTLLGSQLGKEATGRIRGNGLSEDFEEACIFPSRPSYGWGLSSSRIPVASEGPRKPQKTGSTQSAMSYPRERVVTPRQHYRLRKTKCGNQCPCRAFCSTLGAECRYEARADHSSYVGYLRRIIIKRTDKFSSVLPLPTSSTNTHLPAC